MAVNLLRDSVLNFAVDLYGQLKPKDEDKRNIFFSPFSISAALSMALGGARNKTAEELCAVLRVPDDVQIHSHFSDFFSKLKSYAPDVKLHIANRMYCEQTFPVLASYLSLLRDSYGATIESVDFKSDHEAVRLQANAWVERETEYKIKDLLPGGSVNAGTTLILINAIYFKGLWASQFRPDATRPSDFHLDSKSKKKVEMMFHKDSYSTARCQELDVEALEITYTGNKTSMVILRPNDVEGLSKLEERLTASKLASLLDNLCGFADVELYLPKFKLEQAISLKEVLHEMGIKDFFSLDADLSSISEKKKLAASEVVHKAFVEVNEEGTEAAAATAVMMVACCIPNMAVNQLGDSVLNFAIGLYGQLKPKDGRKKNIFFSPFSISAALSMALGGARNKTAKELSTVLRVPDDAQIHRHFSDFFSKLSSYAADVKLHIANRMYCEQTFPVLESYLSLLRDSYGATVESVDFKNKSETIRLQANEWVERETESKIKDLLPGGSVNDNTTLILINAIYFKGLWASQFEPDATHPSYFHLDSKSKKQVDMMFQKDRYCTGRSKELGVEALEIPYRGGKIFMVILLPDELGGLSKLEKRLTASKLGNLLENLRGFFDVELYLPKFKLEQTMNLKEVMKQMGINDFFSFDADLSAISEKDKLAASEVVHKAFVEVNEEGTEAAAATAVMMAACCLSSAPPQTYKFIVDRPFMFVIRSRDPDLVLFMGSVRDL